LEAALLEKEALVSEVEDSDGEATLAQST
jgi:hypothetical protein